MMQHRRHLILVYNTSLQVYTTADSLLVRRIPINLNASSLSDRDSANATIIAASLSPTSPNHVYVAVSDGRIFKLDWTRGNEAEQKTPEPLMRTKRNHVADMAVAALPFRYSTSGGVSAEEDVALRDVLFVVEQDTSESVVTWYFTTYLESDSAAARKNPKQKTKGKGKRKADPSEDVGSESESEDQQRLYKRLYKFKPDQAGGIPLVRTFDSGRIVIGACGNVLFLGALESVGEPQMFGSVSYTFFSLSSLDLITSVDARIQTRPRGGSSSGQLLVNGATHIEETDTVDVVVGGVRGTLLVYSDLLAKLQRPGVPLAEGERRAKEPLEPRKYHWHRKAVYGVKWSRDGKSLQTAGGDLC